MGFGGISAWQLLIVLGIALLVFGTSRLKTLGTDLGGAIKGFRRAMEHEDGSAAAARSAATATTPLIAEHKAEGVAAERTEAEKHA